MSFIQFELARKIATYKIVFSALSFSVLYRAFRQLFTGKPSRYYEDLGFDVVEGLGPTSDTDKHVQLWQNCGYWIGNSSYDQACKRLVNKVGSLANLCVSDTVLDVGFGFGEQDVFWAEEFGVKKIIGINVTPFQVDFASKRALQLGLSDILEYHVGDAVEIEIPCCSVDKVICLQSAFQFNTREQFFKEAFRVLKPGGLLVIADMIPIQSMMTRFSLWSWVTRRRVGWPHENNYSASTYQIYMENSGFSMVEIESIRDHVFPGMKEYIRRRYNGEKDSQVLIDTKFLQSGEEASALWRHHYGVDDYVLVKAVKSLS